MLKTSRVECIERPHQCTVQDLSIYRLAPCTENCSQDLSKTFSFKDLEDISYFRNFELEKRSYCNFCAFSQEYLKWLQIGYR
jgi:hypothetical protein